MTNHADHSNAQTHEIAQPLQDGPVPRTEDHSTGPSEAGHETSS